MIESDDMPQPGHLVRKITLSFPRKSTSLPQILQDNSPFDAIFLMDSGIEYATCQGNVAGH